MTHHRSWPSIKALQDIVAAIHDVQQGHKAHLQQIEDQSQRTLEAIEHLIQVFVSSRVEKLAEREVALSMTGSQEGNGVSLMMDYDEELSDVGI